jgi:prevent-host-death family protein
MNMKTISAGEANRHFSSALREVINGETVIVTSCGKPVVTISPMRQNEPLRRVARPTLLERLQPQLATSKRNWTRDEI